MCVCVCVYAVKLETTTELLDPLHGMLQDIIWMELSNNGTCLHSLPPTLPPGQEHMKPVREQVTAKFTHGGQTSKLQITSCMHTCLDYTR